MAPVGLLNASSSWKCPETKGRSLDNIKERKYHTDKWVECAKIKEKEPEPTTKHRALIMQMMIMENNPTSNNKKRKINNADD